jgi:hypothetical protein
MPESRPEKNPSQPLIFVRESIEDYLKNFNALLDKDQSNPLFLDEEEIISSLKKIRFAAWTANSKHVPSEEIVDLLKSYHDLALANIYYSASYSYTFNDEKHKKYQKAALEFAITINVPPIKISKSWLSGIPVANREDEFNFICQDPDFNLTEIEKKQLRKEFFSGDSKKIESSSDDPYLQIFKESLEQKGTDSSLGTLHLREFFEKIENELRNRLDLFLGTLIDKPHNDDKYLLNISGDFRNVREKIFFLIGSLGIEPEKIYSILAEYQERIVKILGITLQKFYYASDNRIDFINDLTPADKDYIEICFSTTRYFGLENKECLLKILDFFGEEEKENVMISVQETFRLNNEEFLEIKRKIRK